MAFLANFYEIFRCKSITVNSMSLGFHYINACEKCTNPNKIILKFFY